MDGSIDALKMVEEGQNQPEFPPNQISTEESREEEDEDRISSLPDCLLVEILSLLPTIHAIRTGALSKRWKHIWLSVPILIFVHVDTSVADFVSFVDKTLTQRGELKLKEFGVLAPYNSQFETQVRDWIRYAINCEVETLHLILHSKYGAMFCLDDLFFTSSCFTDLTLSGCIFDPIGAISWKKLRSLRIEEGYLDEDLIENILSGSPVLETLVLQDCYGFRKLSIKSKSVKKLVLSGCFVPEDDSDEEEEVADVIELNAPNILSLEVRGDLLWKILLVNLSSLVEAKLYYTKLEHYETTRNEAEEEMLKQLILKLRHVKELKICCRALSRLKAKGFICPSNVKVCDYLLKLFDKLQEQVDATSLEDDEADA